MQYHLGRLRFEQVLSVWPTIMGNTVAHVPYLPLFRLMDIRSVLIRAVLTRPAK